MCRLCFERPEDGFRSLDARDAVESSMKPDKRTLRDGACSKLTRIGFPPIHRPIVQNMFANGKRNQNVRIEQYQSGYSLSSNIARTSSLVTRRPMLTTGRPFSRVMSGSTA